jgi:hypothetical protein
MGAWIDRTGERYGRVVVIEDKPGQGHNPQVTVKCDCGTITVIHKGRLKGRKGCRKCQTTPEGCSFPKTHGMSHLPVYNRWNAFKKIMVREWRDSIQAYYAAVGNALIKRIDETKPLGPGNWKPRDAFKHPVINGRRYTYSEAGRILKLSRERARKLALAGNLEPRLRKELEKHHE